MGALIVMLGLVAGLAVVLTGFFGPAGVARADTPDNDNNPYFTLTMSPSASQNLVDGQAMPFTVTRTALGTSFGLEIAAVGTGWCGSDVQLPVSENPGNQSFNSLTTGFPLVASTTPGAPPENCLDYINSDLSAVVANGSSLPTIAPKPNTATNVAGTSGDYPTVSGQALAEVGQGGQQPLPFNNISVNCLPSQPCMFAVAVWTENVLTPGQDNVYFLGVPATFLDSSAGLACSGPASGQIASESPDRLGETLTQLGIDACRSGIGGGEALTDNLGSGNSDDEALCAFASDSVDLAYSAVGYQASGSDFSPAKCQGGAEPSRPYVAIPIGLNAVVLGHSPNNDQATPYKSFGTALTDYSQLRITLGQIGTATEQWRLRGRHRLRTIDERQRDLGQPTGPGPAGVEPSARERLPGFLRHLQHRRGGSGCNVGDRRHHLSRHQLPQRRGAHAAGQRARSSGSVPVGAARHHLESSGSRLPRTRSSPTRDGASSRTT